MTTMPATFSGPQDQAPQATTTSLAALGPPQVDAGLTAAVQNVDAALTENAVASGVAPKSPAKSAAAKARPRGPGGTFLPKGATPAPTHDHAPDAAPTSPAAPQGPSSVVTPPVQPAGVDPDAAGPALSPDEQAARESLGRVASETLDNLADGLGGPSIKPTKAERESLDHYLGRALGGLTIPAVVAVAIIAGGWLVRVWVRKRQEAAATAASRTSNPPVDRGPDQERQDDAGATAGGGNPSLA